MFKGEEALFVKELVGISKKGMPNFCEGVRNMYDVLGVYLVSFEKNKGGELSGKHYALILTPLSNDNTLLVAPITSKKSGKRYRGGFTINCTKYQENPSYKKAFIRVNKIREIDKKKIWGDKIYDLDEDDIKKLRESFMKVFKFLEIDKGETE